jgi:hypothetical protein
MGVSDSPVLLGNSFPLSLVRRRVVLEPAQPGALREALHARGWKSFWGHANTLAAAGDWLGVDVTPESERPALTLDASGLPMLGGRSYGEVWLLSPEYPEGFRPRVGEEVSPAQISDWRVLRMEFEPAAAAAQPGEAPSPETR